MTSVKAPSVSGSAADGARRDVTVDIVPQFQWRNLLQFGFECIGEWSLAEDGILLEGMPPNEPGVYAFVLDESVVYVGVTEKTLKKRMGQYRSGHVGQKTNARVKKLICRALSEGGKIKVLTCSSSTFDWNGLPLELGPSLEATLIRQIQPGWNLRGKGKKS